MSFEDIVPADLTYLGSYTPDTWGDITPRFKYFIESDFCHPIKLVENGKTLAIGTIFFHEDTAWLACIIVPPEFRNKGYGTIITQELLDRAIGKVETVSLDATEFGYPVYKKLGFEVETEYKHFNFLATTDNKKAGEEIIDFNDAYHDQVLQLDKTVSGENRQRTLLDAIPTSKVFLRNNRVEGFYMPDLADGLIIAETTEAGLELIKYRMTEKTYASLPADNKAGLSLIDQLGFQPVRTSRRMRFGKKREVQLNNIYNRISGMLG